MSSLPPLTRPLPGRNVRAFAEERAHEVRHRPTAVHAEQPRRRRGAPALVHVLRSDAGASQTGAANDRIQVGIIGVGARVQSGLLDAVVAVPGVEVIGVCDAYKGRVTRALERLGTKAKDYGDWRAILADKSIDAVIIGTPDHWHKQQTLEALAAGKDVYLEKPMTFTIDDGPEMYAAAEKTGPHPAGRQPGHQLEAAADGARDHPVRQARRRST